MVLVDHELRRWAGDMHGVHPFDDEMINPSSIDLRAGMGWIDSEYPHLKRSNLQITIHRISLTTLLVNAIVDVLYKIIKADKLLDYRRPTAVLLSTLESVAIPVNTAAMVKLKTTPSREGLGHPIADWVDNGFMGQLTLMVTANKTITISAGDRICQLVVMRTKTPNKTYRDTGHYYNQTGVTPSWRQNEEQSQEDS